MIKKILFLLAVLSPALAFSASLGFDPTPGDVTVNQLLSKLFGGLISSDVSSSGVSVASGGADPLAAVLSSFNAVVLLFGGVLLAYGLVAGTMQTAHDGEVLGKRWSSMWLPIRISIGVAAIIPLSSGYAVIQYIVMWLVIQGVGAADTLWSAYSANAQPLAQIALGHDFDKTNKLASIALKQSICAVTINTEIENAKAKAQAEGLTYNGYQSVTIPSVGEPIPKTNGLGVRPCGSYELSTAALYGVASTDNTLADGSITGAASEAGSPSHTGSEWSSIRSLFGSDSALNSFSKIITDAHKEAYTTLQASMIDIAKGIYDNKQNESTGLTSEQASDKYGKAVDAYNKKIAAAVTSAIGQYSNTNDVARNASQDGWGLAGAWYLKYTRMQQALSNEIQKFPKLNDTQIDKLPSDFKIKVSSFDSAVLEILKGSKYTAKTGLLSQAEDDLTNSSGFDPSTKKADSGYFLSRFTKETESLTANGTSLFNIPSGKNPILSLSDAGSTIFNMAITAQFGVALLAMAPLVGSAVTALMPLTLAVFGALMGASAILAFYLPIAPFIIWFGVVLGWCVMVIEAIIAAPLWAIIHVHPDGDGIVGKGGAGYSLVLGLIIRPSLAILGLIASMALMQPIGELFIQTYWTVFATSKNGWFFSWVASITIFSMIMYSIVNRVFSLIHIIPDQILRWIGGSGSDLGQYAGDLGGAGTKNASAIGGVIGGMAGQAISGNQNRKQLNAQRESTAAQERGNEIARQEKLQNIDSKSGDGMGQAMQAGDAAVAQKLAAAKGQGVKTDTPEFNQSLREARDKAMTTSYDSQFGEGAMQARQEFDTARSKFGLGEASAADYNKFNRDRSAHMSDSKKQESNPFSPEKHVQDSLKRQGVLVSGEGQQAAPAAPTSPAAPSGNSNEDK